MATGERAGPTGAPRLVPKGLRHEVGLLCAIGNRFVGTAGERAAAAHLLDRFRDAGLTEVRDEAVDALAYRPASSSITVPDLPALSFPSAGLQFTAAAVAEAPAVYLGTPRTMRDIETLARAGVPIRGRIAVVQSYWPYLLVPRLVEAGAAGVVIVSPVPDGLLAHFSAQLYPPPDGPAFEGLPMAIPGVTVERDAGGLLAALAANSRTVQIMHDARYEPTTSSNVVGVARGTERPDEYVVIGAHYDTQLEGVGACDNASGVAALIELARWCVQNPRRRTVVFAALAAEEQGSHGAISYCRRHAATLERTRAMVCLDALSWVYPARRAIHADPSMAAFAARRAAELGWPAEEEVDASMLVGSDHNPFIDAGVPSCWFWRYPPQHPYYHSSGETIELVDFTRVTETAVVAGYTAFSVADGDEDLGRSRPTRRWLDLRARPV